MGINHIYATNQKGLFFAQGYCAAKDRSSSLKFGEGKQPTPLLNLLGEPELKRDVGTRMFKFRGNMKT